jgi:hypothetical protein
VGGWKRAARREGTQVHACMEGFVKKRKEKSNLFIINTKMK